jgi:hypothetical protein
MSNLLSPELVLVLTDEQRTAAIRALPSPPVWQPEPLGAIRTAARPALRAVLKAALLYFIVKLLWTMGTAVLYVLTLVAVAVVVATLVF